MSTYLTNRVLCLPFNHQKKTPITLLASKMKG